MRFQMPPLQFDPARPSTQEIEELTTITRLHHLIHHRNKNQHRRSTWWRHFSIYRRHLLILLSEIELITVTPVLPILTATQSKKLRGKSKGKPSDSLAKILAKQESRANEIKAAKETYTARLELWRDVCIPKWNASFGQLVKDTQFSALGLVLLASLARACWVFGVTEGYDALVQEEMRRVLVDFVGQGKGLDPGEDLGDAEVVPDVGEIVERAGMVVETTPHTALKRTHSEEEMGDTGAGQDPQNSTLSHHTQQTKKSKKKKRTGNAIDDIFSGF